MTLRHARPLAHAAIAALLVLFLAACQANPYRWGQETGKANDAALEQAGKPAPPADVSRALLDVGAAVAPAAPLEKRFDIAVNNAPARQVFLSLVEATPYSVVLHPDVSGSVSLQLKEVTVPEAMEALRRVYGYDFRRDGHRYYIHGSGMQSRIFPVNYINFQRKGRSSTRVSSGELTQGGPSSRSGGTLSPSTPAAPPTGTTGVPSAGTQVDTQSDINFWKDIADGVTTLIGNAPGRKVVVNAQAGIVLVRAMPDELRLVEDFLGITTTNLNRQVVIEAKILNVELNNRFQTGINWAALGGNTVFGQTGGGTIFDSGVSEIAGNTGVLNPISPPFSAVSNTATSAFGGVFSAAIKTADFAAFLELLKTQGDVQVLSSPRVSTLNNQKALIKVGGDEYFITGVSSTPSTVLGGQPTTEVELTPFFSGIALDVTPQIDDSGNIVLHIHPAVSEVTQRNKNFTINNQPSSLPLAVSTIQESDNVVRARTGQFVVIGGLMKEGTTDSDASIPLLGDIPLLGNAFKHKRITRIKSELVILLRPTIVDVSNDAQWSEDINRVRDRTRRLRDGP